MKSQAKEEKDNIKLRKTSCKTFDVSNGNTLGNTEHTEGQHPTANEPAPATKSPVVADNLKERSKVSGDYEIPLTNKLPATEKLFSPGNEITNPDKKPAATKSSQVGIPPETAGVSETVDELRDTEQQKSNESRKAVPSINTITTSTCSEPVQNTRKQFRDGENISVSKIKSSLSLPATHESLKKTNSESSKLFHGNDRLSEVQTKKRVQKRKRPVSVGTSHLVSDVPIKKRRHLSSENDQNKFTSFALLMKCSQVQDMDIESDHPVTSAPQAMEIETVGQFATPFRLPFKLFRPECTSLPEENGPQDMELGDSGSSPLTFSTISGHSTSPMSSVTFNQTNQPQTMEFEEGNNDLVPNVFSFFSQDNGCNELVSGNSCGQENVTDLQFDELMEESVQQQTTAPYFATSNKATQPKSTLRQYLSFSGLLFKLEQIHQIWKNTKACDNGITLHKIYSSVSSLSSTESVSDCSIEDNLEINDMEEMIENFKRLNVT